MKENRKSVSVYTDSYKCEIRIGNFLSREAEKRTKRCVKARFLSVRVTF